MSFLWKAIGLLDTVPGFPYRPQSKNGTSVTTASPTIKWTMCPGVSNDDGRPVTIFSTSLTRMDALVQEMARHSVKRAKSLLLPGLLRCYGATEHQDTVYIATEPCEPLRGVLKHQQSLGSWVAEGGSDSKGDEDVEEEEAFLESVALGLKTVGTALTALHHNNLVHGNVSFDSVYVLPSGEWRLFGLELVSTFNELHGIYQRCTSLLPEYRRPPETQKGGCEQSLHVSNTDSWGMACLIYEVLGVPKERSRDDILARCTASDLRGCRILPRTLQSGFIGLCAANAKVRHDVNRFLNNSEFIVGSQFVQCMQTLEELSLKEIVERERFFEHLSNVSRSFPKKACTCVLLPKLQASLNFGLTPAVIDPVLSIAARITAPEDHAMYVAPIIVRLFASQDRMVRYRLLQRASEYAPLLPASVVNEQLWPAFVLGFSNPVPGIREHSARALVSFSTCLSDKIMLEEVPKYIGQLQQDAEGAIRTNATIALCLMADRIPGEQRSKILVHGFGRMLKDPFIPSRTGALRSFQSTIQHLTPQHIADLLVPGVGPVVMDSVAEVRQTALDLLSSALLRLNAYHAEELMREKKTEHVGVAISAAYTTPEPANPKTTRSKWGLPWGTSATTPTDTAAPNTGQSELPGTEPSLAKGPVGSLRVATSMMAMTTTGPLTTSETTEINLEKEDMEVPPAVVQPPVMWDATRKSFEQHVSSNNVTESTTGGGAMKLRKKGLGASRIS